MPEGKILKYAIPRQGLHEPVNVPMPVGAEVLSAVGEGLRPFVYAVGESDRMSEPRWFQLLWTSDRWPSGAVYVGTVSAGPDAAWHVVEFPDLRGHA